MEVEKAILSSFLQNIHHFEVPVYQRRYTWDKILVEKFWSDVFTAGNKMEISSHMMGSIVVTMPNVGLSTGVVSARLIDGQQRVITAILFLRAFADYLSQVGPTRIPLLNGDELLVDEDYIDGLFLINKHISGNSRFRAVPGEFDRGIFIKILKRESLSGQEVTSSIAQNYQTLKDLFTVNSPAPQIILSGLNKIEIVAIKLHDGKDDPQIIFENLNSIGESLSQIDLIRNDVLLGLNDAEQKEISNDYWKKIEDLFPNTVSYTLEEFFRSFLIVKGHQIDESLNLYRNFRKFKKEYNDIVDLRKLMAEILKYANYFSDCRDPSRVKDNLIRQSLHNIEIFYNKIVNASELSLLLYSLYRDKKVGKDSFIKSLKIIESGVIRRMVIYGNAANRAKEIFKELINDLPTRSNYLDKVISKFSGKDIRGDDLFPRDEEFSINLISRPLYNQADLCKYILCIIEMENNPKERLMFDNLTIEHVMPQTIKDSEAWKDMLGDQWRKIQQNKVHTLGNLTLTGYNSELGNRSFEEKKDLDDGRGYRQSRLLMTRDIADLPDWTEHRIDERAEEITKKALTIWPSLENL